MTDVNEGVSTPHDDEEPKQNPEKNKKGLKIRLALFFDGTLNNRNNINVRELAGDSHDTQGGIHLPPNTEKRFKIVDGKVKELLSYPETYEKFRDPSGPNSYDNGRTNVNLMEAQVPNKADGYHHYIKVYVEGQGTFDDKKDSLAGYSMGGLSSGVPARAKLGIIRALDLIQDALDKKLPEDNYIQELTIDVFGFSRGAATARQSIHQMLKSTIQPMYKRLRGLGYHDTAKSAVKVCVAGLYDTVLSFWLGQYLHTEWLLDMQAVTEAEHVLHLAAADEHRRDFPVTNIDSAKTKNGEEYFLPGVHSDVGGSYNMALDLEKQKDLPEEHKEYMRTTAERDRIINRGHPNILEQDRANLIAQGWYEEHEIKVKTILHGAPGVRGQPPTQPLAELVVSRSGIRSAYSNIPLKIMAEFAQKHGVNFLPELIKVANRILRDEKDLLALEEKIRAYINPARGKATDPAARSKPEDWLNDESIKSIRHRHFNFSSKVGAGYSPRIVNGIRTRYIVHA